MGATTAEPPKFREIKAADGAMISVRCGGALTPIGKLQPHPLNDNQHSDAQIQAIAGVLRRNGWRVPIRTNADRIIVAGEGRWRAAQFLGLKTVPVEIQAYENDAEVLSDLAADNALARLATTDTEKQKALLEELSGGVGDDLEALSELTGFAAADLEDLLVEDVALPAPAPAPEVADEDNVSDVVAVNLVFTPQQALEFKKGELSLREEFGTENVSDSIKALFSAAEDRLTPDAEDEENPHEDTND